MIPNEKDDPKSRMPVQRGCRGEEIKGFSDTELVAAVLGTGSRGKNVMECAESLLNTAGGISGIFRSGLRELAACSGVGLVKAVKLQCALELGRRIISSGRELTHAGNPESVWQAVLPDIAGLEQEEFRVLVVNSKNRILKKSVISVGTVSETLVHPREVFREAIREGGSGIIVTHNHPSGALTPSQDDLETTGRLVEAGKIIGIPLLDHVIVTERAYCSLKEKGYI